MAPRSAGGRPRVVVVGAGFGGLATVQALRGAEVAVTLVDRHNYHLFQPLLYQVASAVLDPSDIATPVRAILRRIPNCDFRLGEVTSVDLEHRVVHSTAGELAYDHLVLATGSANSYFGIASVAERAYGLKDLGEALALRSRVLEMFEQAAHADAPEARRTLLTFAIIGAGPTGVEFAGALSELVQHVLNRDFRVIDTGEVHIVLIEATGSVLGAFPSGLGRRAETALRRKGVEILLRRQVAGVEQDAVILSGGDRIAAATIVWTAGVGARRPGELALPRAAQSRVAVDPATLAVQGHPGVYAVGDVAACAGADGRPLPMLAPVAIQQGKQVARQIAATTRGDPAPPPFRYFDKGTMATVGRNVAVAQIGPLRLSGFIGWLGWLFVHLMSLVNFRSRLVVLAGWAWNYVFYDRPVRLISAPTPPPAGTDDDVDVSLASRR